VKAIGPFVFNIFFRGIDIGSFVKPGETDVHVEYEAALDDMRRAVDNGAKVIYAAIGIERLIEGLATTLKRGPASIWHKRRNQLKRILKPNSSDLAGKSDFAASIVDDRRLLETDNDHALPGDRDRLRPDLKRIENWRNAFAHGRLKFVRGRGVLLLHENGEVLLSDEFWTGLEQCFEEATAILFGAQGKLNERLTSEVVK
jgi:hypothetical protein